MVFLLKIIDCKVFHARNNIIAHANIIAGKDDKNVRERGTSREVKLMPEIELTYFLFQAHSWQEALVPVLETQEWRQA